jgi:hypothetical protein
MACRSPQRLKPRATRKHQACLRRLPPPSSAHGVWAFGGESPPGDLAVVAREFIRRAENACNLRFREGVTVLCETEYKGGAT